MKSNTRKVLLGATTLAALGIVGAGDANAANTNVNITAQIIQAVDITATATLKFGKLTQSKTTITGTVVVDGVAGTRAAAGSANLVGGTAATAGGFTLKGATGINIDVSAPATTKITNGANKLVVDQFTIENAAGTINGTPYVKALAATSSTGFRLGGRLNLPSAAVATGTYSGTVTLTANYQ